MAGTIQSLFLAPSPPLLHFKTSSFSHRLRRFSTTILLPNALSIAASRSCRSTVVRASQRSDQADDSNESKASSLVWAKPLLKVASDNFLPLALVVGVALGLANPTLGCLADKYYMSKFSTFGIFIISGLTLRSEEIGAAVEAWPVAIFGLCSILLFTPYFSKIIMQIQLQPQEFITGLAIFTCMPTTLSSGVALTQLAGGNSALALAMTLISNLLGILIVPLSISKFIAAGVGVSVPTKELFRNLVLMLLVPLILGKVLRESSKGLAEFVDRNRKIFSKISAICLGLVPWIQVSRSRSLLLMVKPTMFIVAIGMGILVHLVLLAFNAIALKSISALSGGEQSSFSKKGNFDATLLVASQKTLPVMVAVVEQLGGAFGESGLLVLPCVAAHINQIILDSFLVNFWLRDDLSTNNVKVA
ncbi:probable sodium/metabolite cotransporter BASS4, chloroplastic [Rutidosis leptorrhynchoides]|uniref:probable sodium/metabolite cotransporter BASS4, chloroplastic n=1 Tax=Rutidosis leptorrhynchoides TaxID=125765 RepID=UPI003A993E6D